MSINSEEVHWFRTELTKRTNHDRPLWQSITKIGVRVATILEAQTVAAALMRVSDDWTLAWMVELEERDHEAPDWSARATIHAIYLIDPRLGACLAKARMCPACRSRPKC